MLNKPKREDINKKRKLIYTLNLHCVETTIYSWCLDGIVHAECCPRGKPISFFNLVISQDNQETNKILYIFLTIIYIKNKNISLFGSALCDQVLRSKEAPSFHPYP